MDFARLMAAEISKKRAAAPEPDTTGPSAKKYQKRSDVEAERQAAYLREEAAIEAARAATLAAQRAEQEEAAEATRLRKEKLARLADESAARRAEEEREIERARRRRLGLPDLVDPETTSLSEADGAQEALTPEELADNLRGMGEPVILFGETHETSLRRFRRLQRKQAEKIANARTDGPVPTSLTPVAPADMKLSPKLPATDDVSGRQFLYRQLASYFTLMLHQWEVALASEDATGASNIESQSTFAAATARRALVSARSDLTPLFRRFERADVPEAVLSALVEIVVAAQERRYVDANDGYLRLAIGKAAWPIGVTMVGIHERSAREKIGDPGAGEIAHVMGNEVTRKYLQAVKRCLTFAQVRWPPQDVGQMMG